VREHEHDLPRTLPQDPLPPGDEPFWVPDAVPVALWSEADLRAALGGTPGPALARVVAELTDPHAEALDSLADDVLGDLATACDHLQSWAAGMQARVVAERAARESHPLAHSSLVGMVTSELAVTGAEATDVVVRAESGAVHPAVVRALERGRIDVRKAHTLLRSASQLTTQERARAIDRYLPQAPHRTWRWLRDKMLAFAKSLHGAAESARDAARHRNVQVDRADNDMGWISAYLPAVDAAAVWGVVDEMAHQLRRVPGEERDLGQLRADSLTGIVTGRLVPAGRFTVATDTTDGTHRTSSTDSAPTCPCGGPAPVVRVTPTRPVVRVTVPATALLGLDDAPAELDGLGPVPADTAAQIAVDATWRRLVTDPVTGVLVDHSTTTYRPGRVLRQAVTARDRTCTFPSCEKPAERSDLDHIVPFDHDLDPATLPPGTPGQTRAGNLHALCRRHHQLKTAAGWTVERDPLTGVTTWTLPTGRTRTRPPTVLDPHVDLGAVDPLTSHRLTLRILA